MGEIISEHLAPSQLIADIMAIFMVIGAFDCFRGNKWGLGAKFEEAFGAFASLAVNMVGIITLVPIIEKYLAPLIAPLFSRLGIDPAVTAGMILANDMGGYQLATAIANTPEGANLGGMLLASMLGVNIVFNIPVSLGLIDKGDRAAMAKGMSCGFITIPIGCLAGTLAAGYDLMYTLINLIPVIIIAIIIAVLLKLVPDAVTKIFIVFGKIIMAAALFGTVVGIFQYITGFTFIKELAPVTEGFDTVVSIIMMLPGAYVLVHVLGKVLNKPLGKLGNKIGIGADAMVGLLTTTANAIPTFSMIKAMDERGKIINFAFIVSAGYLLGDHLAFCTALNRDFVLPLLIGKLTSGICAVILAALITEKKKTNSAS